MSFWSDLVMDVLSVKVHLVSWYFIWYSAFIELPTPQIYHFGQVWIFPWSLGSTDVLSLYRESLGTLSPELRSLVIDGQPHNYRQG